MGAGAAVFRGNQAKLITYTLMNPRYGHMIVEVRVTAEDEDTLMADHYLNPDHTRYEEAYDVALARTQKQLNLIQKTFMKKNIIKCLAPMAKFQTW